MLRRDNDYFLIVLKLLFLTETRIFCDVPNVILKYYLYASEW
jgi:hypothetical protein